MIPKPVEKLLVEIAKKVGKDKHRVTDDPERWLVALLLNIDERVTSVSAMLDRTVSSSFFDSRMARADRLLGRHKSRKSNHKKTKVLTTA